MRRVKSARRGFSLVELVIVVVIICVIAPIPVPRLSRGAKGAGGAARAVIHGLAAAGTGKIYLVNRTESNARKVVEDLGDNIKAKIQVVPWSERSNELEDATLLVNTTSLGMQGQPALEISLARLGPNAIVSDIVYTPLETDLLAQAKQRGHPIVDGLGMLIHQARPGFKAWFGRDPEVTEGLRKFLIADLME